MKLETDAKFEARSRSNGWSLPPHPLQFISWGCVLYFAIIYYTTLVPGLPTEWQPAGYIIQGLASLCHVITHLVASTINPADPAVLRKHHKRLAMFDRQKHRHVIENQHCYLCDVNVGAKSKHCSACNKCVSDFDHHCKWLNNCVGGRNYRWFISTLVSAIVSCLLMFIISLLQFVAYYTDREDGLILQQYRDFVNSNASLTLPVFEVVYQSVSDEGWQSVVAITGILNFLSLGLLIHLLTFHIYLLCKGISTYEFIVKQREAAMELSDSDSAEDGRGKGARAKGNKIAPSNGRASIELKEKPSEDSFRAGKKKFSRKTESEWPDDFRAAKGSDGETPPPAPSPPTQLNSLNTQNYSAKLHPVGVKKKRKRKKKAPRPMPVAKEEGEISTIGTPDLYKRHGFEARRIELPITPVTIRRSAEFTPPLATVEDFHSDSAESLKEIPTNSSYPTNISRTLPYAPNGKMTDSIHLSNGDARVSGVGDQLFGRIDGSQPHSPFSLTTIQNGSLSSGHSYPGADDTLTRLSADQGSLSKGRSISPLAYHALPPLSKPGQVPPLDLSVLRTSAESCLSYQPYSGLRSATDTYRHYEPFEPSEKTLQEAVLEV